MKRILIIALIATPCLLALSYPWRHQKHGAGAFASTVGWLGFLLCLLTIIVMSIALAVNRVRTRHA